MTTVRRVLGLHEHLSVVDVVLAILRVVVVLFVVAGVYATISKGTFTLDEWGSLAVGGLALGAVYALLALGYTLVYGILFMINFAHGDVFMTGAYTAYFAAAAMAKSGFLAQNEVLAFIIVLLISSGVAALVAVVLERVAYRPLRNAPRLVPLITAIGASLFLENTFRGLYGAGVKAYPTWQMFQGSIILFGIEISYSRIVVVFGAIAMMLGLYWFVERTRTGRAMRAVSENKDVAAMMGIDVDRVILDDLRHRRPAGRRRRHPLHPDLQPGRLLHGLRARHQGLHRGRAGRHRQHRGCHARRTAPGRPGVGWPLPPA